MNTFSLQPDSNPGDTGCLPVSESTGSTIDYFAKPWGPLSRNNLANYSNSLLQMDLRLHFRSPSSIFAQQNSLAYDATGQLTTADYDYQTDETYTYDANGNRTVSGYTTGANNQLTSDGTYDYTYDDEGNRTRKTNIATGDYTDYTWDHLNRLTQIENRDTAGVLLKEVQYTYDLFGSRIAKAIDADADGVFETEEHYVYDGLRAQRGAAGDHIALAFDGSGDLTNRYLYGPAVDQILADEQVVDLLTAGDVLWPLSDNLGSIRDLASYDDVLDTTTVANHLIYDAFGNVTSETDTAIDHLFGFTGRERDEESDLQYNRARYYDASTGRWISEDPLSFAAGDANLARYVGNRATNATDPSGLEDPDANAPWPRGLREPDSRGPNARENFQDYYNWKYPAEPAPNPPGDFWDGVLILAEDADIPDALYEWAEDANVKIKKGSSTWYSPWFDTIYMRDGTLLARAERIGRQGELGPNESGIDLGYLGNEVFHAWYDQVATGSLYGAWLLAIMDSQDQFGNELLIKAEEAMSELVNHAINEIASGNRIPTYDEILSNDELEAWKNALTPGHDEIEEKWNGDPTAKFPISEELYYATFWILDHGIMNPRPNRQPGSPGGASPLTAGLTDGDALSYMRSDFAHKYNANMTVQDFEEFVNRPPFGESIEDITP